MENSDNLAFGLAAFSLLLAAGGSALKRQNSNAQRGQHISTGWFGKIARFFYFVAIPYVAVIFGIITPSLLGLTGAEYFALINWNGAALTAQIQQATTLTLLDWLMDSSGAMVVGLTVLFLFWAIWSWLKRVGVTFLITKPSLPGAAYAALHWAFYRAIFWSVTGNLYLASVIGIVFVMLEWSLCLWLEKAWQHRQPQYLVNSMVLLLTTIIFFYSPNLWLLFPFHLAMITISGQGLSAKTARLSAS